MNSDLFKKIIISRVKGIGFFRYFNLLKKYKTVDDVYNFLNPTQELVDSVLKEIDLSNKLNIKYIDIDSTLYPINLKNIKNPPLILCSKGNFETLKKESISIVGTRHASLAGLDFTYKLASSFSQNNFVITSGMAIGTDSAAHKGALSVSGNNQTIAVLAGGLDYIWPLENTNLYHQIIERGLIISEMPTGFTPRANNFIQRNRIIAGLSTKLILGEADLKSGSLATASFMLSYKRSIFAIPSHPLDPRSKGPNKLIKENKATIITGIDDFFSNNKQNINNNKKLSTIEQKILDKLNTIPVSASVLTQIVNENISIIKQNLVSLELKGLIKQQAFGYVRNLDK